MCHGMGMATPFEPYSMAHWRQRAEEARAASESISDPNARRILLEIAQNYEELAERVKRRALTKSAVPKWTKNHTRTRARPIG
jgi:hypothetical protein